MDTIPHNGAVLCVSKITNGTISNTDGLALLIAIKNALVEFDGVVSIDFQGVIAFSSSFLNSSIGALCEEMGIDVLHRLRITNCSPAALKQLRTYIADTKEIA